MKIRRSWLRNELCQNRSSEKQACSEEDLSISSRICTAITNYFDAKVPVSMMKQGSSSSTTDMVQSLTAGEQGEDEGVQHEVT